MAVETMNIVGGAVWLPNKLGTADFDPQRGFTLIRTNENPRVYPLADMTSAEWEPNGRFDRLARQPWSAFGLVLVLGIGLNLVGWLFFGKVWTLLGLVVFSAAMTGILMFSRVHRARFRFTNGDSALLNISIKFARQLRALRPGLDESLG